MANFYENTGYYPKILVVALGKINKKDLHNNGLLLRSLFLNYPQENIAQIYSSGNNEDGGYFGSYYCLSNKDRRFGNIFYNYKKGGKVADLTVNRPIQGGVKQKINKIIDRLFIKTGLYELLFRVKISSEMYAWIISFKPDIIFAQGYNLTFSLLPILIKKKIDVKLSFLTTDDWPEYLYSGKFGENKVLAYVARKKVIKLSNELIKQTDIPFAFGYPMAIEYEKRYSKLFNVVNHSDDPKRFDLCPEKRLKPTSVFSIIAIGNFNCFRWPLLLDMNAACNILNEEGLSVCISVISSAIDPDGFQSIIDAKYIDLYEDPGNDELPCYLKGADLLFLPEGFNESFVDAIRLSISSKAHLFMFCKRPILVYAHKRTGIANYASTFGWADVITERSVQKLTEVVRDYIRKKDSSQSRIPNAYNFALNNHNNDEVSRNFQQILINSKL